MVMGYRWVSRASVCDTVSVKHNDRSIDPEHNFRELLENQEKSATIRAKFGKKIIIQKILRKG